LSCISETGKRASKKSTTTTDVAATDEPQQVRIFDEYAHQGSEVAEVTVYKKALTDAEILSAARTFSSKYMTSIINPD
jgi:hypothetical protein